MVPVACKRLLVDLHYEDWLRPNPYMPKKVESFNAVCVWFTKFKQRVLYIFNQCLKCLKIKYFGFTPMTALICFIQETCFNPLLAFTNLVWASRSLWMSWYIDKHASSQNKMLNMAKQRRQNAKACNQNSFLC